MTFPTRGKRLSARMQIRLRAMLTEIRSSKTMEYTHEWLPVLSDAELASKELLDPLPSLFPAQAISDGHVDLRTYLSRNGKFIAS